MITFGLTGGIASGKSTVTKTFREHSIPIVDADIVARQVVAPGTQGNQEIARLFGPQYIMEDGMLNRVELANLAFSNSLAMLKLNGIMAPLITEEADKQIDKLHMQGHEIVGYDAALICEMGNHKKYSPLIVVHCPQVTQIERLMKRNGLTKEDALLRINAQMPTDMKVKMADYVIDTSKSIEESSEQTISIINKLRPKRIFYESPKDDDGEMFTVKVYKNGAKVWWPLGKGPAQIEYSTGEKVWFDPDKGTVTFIMDENGLVYE